MPGSTVAEVLSAARERYGAPFGSVLDTAKVWVNGEPAGPDTAVTESDEVAILPPVSGGAVVPARAPVLAPVAPTSAPAQAR